MKLTTEQRLSKAVAQLMRKPETKWLSGILLMGKRTISTECPTAATNGVDELYNPGFCDQLNDAELRGVVLHECLHKAFKQLHTWKHLSHEDHRLANMAADYVINDVILTQLNETLPEGCLHDPAFRGMDTGQVFRALQQQQQQQQQQGGKQQQQDGKQPLDQHDWESADLTPDQGAMIERALRQGAMIAGKGKGDQARALGLLPEPKVDWRQALSEFLQELVAGGDDGSWRKPSRRGLAMDTYLPSRVSVATPELVVAVDTSGSIAPAAVDAFLAEVQALCLAVRPSTLHLLYWGSHVAGEETYTPESMDTLVASTRPVDGGGTSPSCVSAWLTERHVQPCAVVFLSDGYVDAWPETSCPQLWVMTTTQRAQSGVTINM